MPKGAADRFRECPIVVTYLQGVRGLMSSSANELMYESKKNEVEALWERARTAGNDTAVQHLRGFVVVELMATELWRRVLPDGGDKQQAPYNYEQLPKIKLFGRTTEYLTSYLDWLHEQLPEREADGVYARHYSSEFNREQQAVRSEQAAQLLGVCGEAAALLRASLKNQCEVGRLGQLLNYGCGTVKVDVPARIKYARYLLDVTPEHAPRGWEFR